MLKVNCRYIVFFKCTLAKYKLFKKRSADHVQPKIKQNRWQNCKTPSRMSGNLDNRQVGKNISFAVKPATKICQTELALPRPDMMACSQAFTRPRQARFVCVTPVDYPKAPAPDLP
ncbi:hypothetical protein NPIL_196021 [Nephila pilipes]|uniref:Uncharacterized protein n=1 Tax=Nephila pilipes TaxID=299642 RepID=A0A8X6NHZ1_NEPPI|nr:hypothetical protein NPIL_196021 [Nephila pilipes]